MGDDINLQHIYKKTIIIDHRHAAGVSNPTTTHTACSRISTRSCSLCCCHEYSQLVLGNVHI